MKAIDDRLVDETVKYITELCAIPSPSGFTRKAEEYLFSFFTALGLKPEYTVKRSVKVCLGGKGHPIVLAAHIDTLGAMVRAIKPNGKLRVSKIGGFPENYIEQENCMVHARDGREYSGRFLLSNPAVHVNQAAGTTARDDNNIEIVLDEKVFSEKDVRALGISAGDFVSFDPRTKVTPSGFVKSRHLDDKASAAILMAFAAKTVREKSVPQRETWLLFSNYEEVGHGGSAGLPASTEEILSVDMGAMGDDLGTDEYCVSICAKDASGPYDYDTVSRLVEIAGKNDIKHAVDIYPFYSSDASASLRAGWDIKHGLLGPGIQASHGYERCHRDGLKATLELLHGYLF